MARKPGDSSTPSCADLMNVGPKALNDLKLLGIFTVIDLANADPTELYVRLEQLTQQHQDPCVWDVFAAIIHEAKTGEKAPWWQWTPVRKKTFGRQPLCKHS